MVRGAMKTLDQEIQVLTSLNLSSYDFELQWSHLPIIVLHNPISKIRETDQKGWSTSKYTVQSTRTPTATGSIALVLLLKYNSLLINVAAFQISCTSLVLSTAKLSNIHLWSQTINCKNFICTEVKLDHIVKLFSATLQCLFSMLDKYCSIGVLRMEVVLPEGPGSWVAMELAVQWATLRKSKSNFVLQRNLEVRAIQQCNSTLLKWPLPYLRLPDHLFLSIQADGILWTRSNDEDVFLIFFLKIPNVKLTISYGTWHLKMILKLGLQTNRQISDSQPVKLRISHDLFQFRKRCISESKTSTAKWAGMHLTSSLNSNEQNRFMSWWGGEFSSGACVYILQLVCIEISLVVSRKYS